MDYTRGKNKNIYSRLKINNEILIIQNLAKEQLLDSSASEIMKIY